MRSNLIEATVILEYNTLKYILEYNTYFKTH